VPPERLAALVRRLGVQLPVFERCRHQAAEFSVVLDEFCCQRI
jgi:hypothetical protein